MVRRVPLGHPDPGRRPVRRTRWAGPPPLLLLATVLGFVAAPLVDQQASTAQATPTPTVAVVGPRSIEPRLVRPFAGPHDGQAARAGSAASGDDGVAPVELAPVEVGVASMNMFQSLTPAEAAQDAARLTADPRVDIVGWQEAAHFETVLHHLSGWESRTFTDRGDRVEVAVSWRSSRFRLVRAQLHTVAPGVNWRVGSYPFVRRFVAVVTLAERATGRQVTVVDTHLPRRIEDADGGWSPTMNAGRARTQLRRLVDIWGGIDTRWVVGTGDYNFDAREDARARTPGGPIATLGQVATSSYQRFGTDVGPTHPPSDRNIDYVWADRAGLDDGRVRLLDQRVPGGYHSDHRPIVVRMRLS